MSLHSAPLDEVVASLQLFDDRHADYMLWLGAGASVSSGVKTAYGVVSEILWNAYAQRSSMELDQAKRQVAETELRSWAADTYSWFHYGGDALVSEYAQVMENYYRSVGIREKFLRNLLHGTEPSKGYRILGQLVEHGVFDTILTTNFDHLIRRGADPVLSTPITEINSPDQFANLLPFPDSPRLVRLHGDFWHGNVLNTDDELENTPSVRFDAVKQLLQSYGLIVVGYGGWDRRLMEDLFLSLRREGVEIRNGLYWCHRSGDSLSPYVESFLKMNHRSHVALVEIDSFDGLMQHFGVRFGITASLEADLEAQLTKAWEDQALFIDLIDRAGKLLEGEDADDIRQEILARLMKCSGGSMALLIDYGDPDHWRIAASVGLARTLPPSTKISPEGPLGECLERGDNYFQSPGGSEDDLGSVFGTSRHLEGFVVWRGESPRCVVVFGADARFPERSQLQPIKAGVELLASLSRRPAEPG